ncbi:MAG: hypothetical protein QOJ86_2618 [Bradyrhizobium sp.]|jgi:hypothetical protein|nr:hypothetical protein [Bradyrhizobium sp.]
MIIIGVANTAGIVGTKCFTVRLGLTVMMRSALRPTVMTSRASMDCPGMRSPHSNVVPAQAGTHNPCR